MDEIDQYIQSASAQGKPLSQIYQELTAAGWNPSTVAAKLNALTEKAPKPSVNKISPMAVFAFALVVVALIIFLVVSITVSN